LKGALTEFNLRGDIINLEVEIFGDERAMELKHLVGGSSDGGLITITKREFTNPLI
jgi:hypothetical protein